ncbi:ABC transporter ATP-binding protein [Chelativorans sp.]|uniref:ABC transporter ATP-binding protein n=1 Tax=Chelativorans sp. TaxID=2203393 RepID=UPI0028119FDA|nr:ABC transporter ATP-binding protein [Chelativorans sp.]
MSTLLSADNVTVTFTGGTLGRRQVKHALDGVSLQIGEDPPAIIAIVGESGSGKTTLTRLLLGLMAPTGGRVSYRGKLLSEMDRAERLTYRREVQAIFQDPFAAYNPFYRVDRALLLPLQRFGLARNRDEAYERIREALTVVGLRPAETLGRYPHQLSGGQRQRVMIARALLLNPRIIIADEPASMVDASLRATILDTLYRLKTEKGISLIYVTHDLTTAYQIADHVLVMNSGKVVESGDPDSVILNPQHPYTKSLISAIPSVDPDVSWGLDDDARVTAHG